MAALTPVSSYLHSAAVEGRGGLLRIRMWPALAGTPEWIVGGPGCVHDVDRCFIAIFQHDLKGLHYLFDHQPSGSQFTVIGIGTPMAIVAAIFHILNHAVFKASLS